MTAATIENTAAELFEREWLTVPEITSLTGMSRTAIEKRIYQRELETRNPRKTREVKTASLLALFEMHGTTLRAPKAGERLAYEIAEVAEMSGMKNMALYQRIHRGQMPYVRIGGKVMVLAADFELLR